MADIGNLRRARKDKRRLREEAEAAANRLAFGLAKATKKKLQADSDLAARRLEAHRLPGGGKDESE